ncbi:Acb2/Tad1 domain-containing protein [Streptomyces sp. URMC 129]|uniref:Acb2/Tad1 domain-containing protein n=1 Tax=Streptomyces sp. URMC 129 TaxID=3423407 RepID=UPI003F1BE153
MIDPADIENRFTYHAPTTDEKRHAHADIREACRRLADQINAQCPDGRAKAVALTKVEEAMMWANAALARQV